MNNFDKFRSLFALSGLVTFLILKSSVVPIEIVDKYLLFFIVFYFIAWFVLFIYLFSKKYFSDKGGSSEH